MDKSILDNEDTSSIEPSKLGTDHSILVETKQIDVLSLPQKKNISGSEGDKQNPPLDEQPLDENWLILSRDWQAQPFEKTDIKKLLKQTKRRTLWAKSLLVIDIIATLGLIIALMVGLYQGDWGTATIAYFTFGSLGSVVFVYYEIQIRLRIWQHSCDSPDKAVENAIAGVESSIKYIKLIKWSCWLLLPAVNWYIYAMIEESEKSPWPPFFAINTFVIIMWLITHWFHIKRERELLQLSSV
ncbi:hypothetical protein CXF85_13140 [Colwellia sp. 75C3]|uniref:hypothetical protein n=1 Tax=Colwellia sp. 75C3 TaxID=888425 RepID=UPI000C349E4E|nr:hypothetical protein [Colwellia sp. 75C3]PKG82429.1 hypothetical protein CXF85_13140 [Colwellia sp. 75C3]